MGDWRQRLEALADRSTCRITTRGRRSGNPHTVTIWFVARDDRMYLGTLRLGRDWPKNVAAHGDVTVEIGDLRLKGEASRVTDTARCEEIARLLARKYWVARIGSWLGFRPQGVFEVRVGGLA